MGYIDSNLTENEHVVFRTKLHWAMLFGPGLLIILAGLWIPSKGVSAVILFSIGFMWAVFSYISFQTSEIGITNKRLLMKIGFPLRRSYDIPLAKIEMVNTYQPSLGKLLNFGKIMLGFAGGGKGSFRMVDSPIEFRAHLERQVYAVLKQQQDC